MTAVDPAAQKQQALAWLAATPFCPAWWARSGLLQTVAAAYGTRQRQALRLGRWGTPDGGVPWRCRRWAEAQALRFLAWQDDQRTQPAGA